MVSLISAKLGRLLPRSINGRLCLSDNYYEEGDEDMKCETVRRSSRNGISYSICTYNSYLSAFIKILRKYL